MRTALMAATCISLAVFSFQPVAQSSVVETSGETSVPRVAERARLDSPAVASHPVNDVAERRAAMEQLIADWTSRSADRSFSQAIAAFYKQRDFRALWVESGIPTPQAIAVVARLKAAAHIGLDPADYPTQKFPAFLNPDEAAVAELDLTNTVLSFVRHSSTGRVSYTRVSGSILYPVQQFDPKAILSQLAISKDADATLASFEPPQSAYKALKSQLIKELANPTTPKNSSKIRNADIIIANMERWRWMPQELGTSHVIVNIPQYSLQLMDRGKQVWATRIVVGKPGEMATPLLTETMKYLTVNPTWNVPPSIIRNEYLPALQRDAGALERQGLKIGRNHDGSVRVYQPPGPKNALGRIRFNFPNPFLVYQHDTPNKNLFTLEKRALSHGCMRVQYPDKYAEALLSISQPNDRITAARIRGLYGDDERTINLQRPIPVHITYQTALVDENGALVRRDDIYGLDAAVLKILRGPERAVADRPIPRDYHSSSKPVLAKNLPKSVGERVEDPRQIFDGQYRAVLRDPAVGTW